MRPEAAALYKRGLERFGGRDYAGAVADLEAGYAIESRREFLFAEGQAKRLAGDCKGAVTLYQRFLATNPAPFRRTRPRSRSAAARSTWQSIHRSSSSSGHARRRRHPRRRRNGGAIPTGWRFTGAGAVGIAVGIGFIAASYVRAPRRRERDATTPSTSRLVDRRIPLAGRRRHAGARAPC